MPDELFKDAAEGFQASKKRSMAVVLPMGICPYRIESSLPASAFGSLSITIFHMAETSPDLSAPDLQWISTGLGAVLNAFRISCTCWRSGSDDAESAIS